MRRDLSLGQRHSDSSIAILTDQGQVDMAHGAATAADMMHNTLFILTCYFYLVISFSPAALLSKDTGSEMLF